MMNSKICLHRFCCMNLCTNATRRKYSSMTLSSLPSKSYSAEDFYNLPKIRLTPHRCLFRFPFKPPLPSNPFSSKVKKYNERRVLGYSKEQLFEVVSRVEDYHEFVPACTKSTVTHREPGFLRADLEIGVPPIIWEKYTSNVTLVKPTLVKAQCADGKIFNSLETEWRFSDGLLNNKNTCTLDFKVSFEFKSHLHSQLVHVFFDEMVRKTVNAFLKRTQSLYGKPTFYINNELPSTKS